MLAACLGAAVVVGCAVDLCRGLERVWEICEQYKRISQCWNKSSCRRVREALSLTVCSLVQLHVGSNHSPVHAHLVRVSYVSSGMPASTLKSLAALLPSPTRLLLLDLAERLAVLLDRFFGIWSVGGRGCAEELLRDSVRPSQLRPSAHNARVRREGCRGIQAGAC